MTEKRNSHLLEAKIDDEPNLLDGINYTGDKGPCLGARHAIIVMMALGSGLISLTTLGFTVIIVAMTTSNTSSNADIPTYNWTNKGVILSSSGWLGIPVQLIAGSLGKRYGHKWLILGSVSANSIFFMLIPAFARMWGSAGVMLSRILSGVALGLFGPLNASVSGLWVPVEERSKASMVGVVCSFIFSVISYLAEGQINATSIGYPGCCYIVGALNLVWCVVWIFLGHQSPATNPRITPEEKKYIETSLSSQKTENVRVPWVKLLTSLHFWAPVVAVMGTAWIDNMMQNVNLIFITAAWKMDVQTSTSTLGVAPIVSIFFVIGLAPLSDLLIKRKYLRIVNARRIFHTVGTIGNATCLLWMTGIAADSSKALIILNLCLNSIFIMVYSVGGAALNILDIAPSFAGIIGGFYGTMAACSGLIAPMTMDWIVKDESNFGEWRLLFGVAAIIVVVTTIFFDIFASDKREWEDEHEENAQ